MEFRLDKQLISKLLATKKKEADWLADQCGVKPTTMEDFLRPGGRTPSLPVLKLMAIALECPSLDPSYRHSERTAVG